MAREVILDRFKFEQTEPLPRWNINHGLNISNPVVDIWILDTVSNKYVNSDAHQVSVLDPLNIQIEFDNLPRTGIALIT